MAVITAFKFDDEVAAGCGARQAHRAHRCFGTGIDEPYLLTRRKSRPDSRGEVDFELGGHAVTGAPARLCGDGFDDLWMRVAQDQRSPGTYIIDIFIPIGVPKARSCRAIGDNGIAAYSTECAHRAVYSTDENFRRAAKDFLRVNVFVLDLFRETHWCLWSSISKSTGLQPARDVFGMIGEHDARAGAMNAGQNLKHDSLFIDPSVRGRRFHHRKFPAHVVCAHRNVERLTDTMNDVEICQRRLHHDHVSALGKIQLDF